MFWTGLYSKFPLHMLASQVKAKNTRVGLIYNNLKIEWDENRNKKTLEYNIDILRILFGVILLKTNNFPVLLKAVKHTFPLKLFFKVPLTPKNVFR